MSRATTSLPHPRPKTPPHQQTHSLPTRNASNLSPTTRDRHLKQILETHRADRQRIQARHDESTGDLTEKLRRALSEVRRIEREFQHFQNGATKRLADVLADNERLRTRIAQLEKSSKLGVDLNKENRSPLRPISKNIQICAQRHGDRTTTSIHQKPYKKEDPPKREPMKPSERELEVERLREAARDSRRVRVPRRPSLRAIRKEDFSMKTKSDASKQSDQNAERRDFEERRSMRLVRSLSRKWSTCF